METASKDELLSLEEAASRLCVSKSTLYRMLDRKEVKGRKVGKQWRFSGTDVKAYLERGPQAVALSDVGPDDVNSLIPSLAAASSQFGVALPQFDSGDESAAKVERFVVHIVHLAGASGASDIHVAPGRDVVGIHLRIDGIMRPICEIAMSAYPVVIGQLKQMAALNMEEKALPQDGRMILQIEGKTYDCRVSLVPTIRGEAVVIRLLDPNAGIVTLDRMGFYDDDLERITRWSTSPAGVVLCTGPTGSGKTTTLYACTQSASGPTRVTLTVEDPVEYELPYTRQSAVNRRAGMTFATTMRALLRQDPDVLLVGEVRDLEASDLVVQAALSGHLVLTTLYADDAPSAAMRFVEMGNERFMVAAALRGVVSQRLVRRICEECKEPITLPQLVELQVRVKAAQGGLPVPEGSTFYHGRGCERCGGSGYRGRRAIYELLEFTPAVADALRANSSAEQLMQAGIGDGMHTLFADGIRKAVAGNTTVDEVVRVSAK